MLFFSDESHFHLKMVGGVCRRRGGRYRIGRLVQTDWWGGVSWWGVGSVIISEQQNGCPNVLQNHVIPFFHQHREMHTFHEDNAGTHTARVTAQYLMNSNAPLFEWPALYPGLSLIKHVWDYLGKRISRRSQMNNLRELENALQQFADLWAR